MSPFVVLGGTGFGNDGRRDKGQGTITFGRKFPVLVRISACSFPGIQHDREPIKSLKRYCWRVRRRGARHFRGTLAVI